jgi:hypothetical protein
MNDLKLALRQLLKNPGFTGTAAASPYWPGENPIGR